MDNEIFDLVNNPLELLHVEIKSWLDLREAKHRADLARHIAAISNFGGGYVVFGFDDNSLPSSSKPESFELNHDIIAAITKKYLDPSIHCTVHEINSQLGNVHFVVVVPPHGATPVCARANGPEIKGKVEGITAGTYYLRKTGPESAPITSSAEWRDIIRRCALHDRAAIMASVSAALVDTRLMQKDDNAIDVLRLWSKAANDAFLEHVGDSEFKVPIRDCHVQFGYMVHTEDPEELPAKNLTDVLRRVCFEVDRFVDSGWSLFYVFDKHDMSPSWKSDPRAGIGDGDFLEVDLINTSRTLGFDLWRIAPLGIATTVREYWEDTEDLGMKPRSFLSPKLMAMALLELVHHADAFSRRFEKPTHVEFFCEWHGLRGRVLHDLNSLPIFSTKPAQVEVVQTRKTWAIGQLASEQLNIAAELGARVCRAFSWHNFTPEWIHNQRSYWKH